MSGYKNGILGVILGAHKLWLRGDDRGFKANLREADLRWANLRGAVGNGGGQMTCIQDRWSIIITKQSIAIGCQQHPPSDWWDFTDSEIDEMDDGALEWWVTHKPIIKALYNAKFGE